MNEYYIFKQIDKKSQIVTSGYYPSDDEVVYLTKYYLNIK